MHRFPEALASADRGAGARLDAPRTCGSRRRWCSWAQGSCPRRGGAGGGACATRIRWRWWQYVATYFDLYWVLSDEQQQLLVRLSPAPFDDDRQTWGLAIAGTWRLRGDTARARAYADSARIAGAAQLREAPQDGQLHALQGTALAYPGPQGRGDPGRRAGGRAAAGRAWTRTLRTTAASARADLHHGGRAGAGARPDRPIQTIFHPSDFSEGSEVAFAHALKIALVAGAGLDILHVSEGGKVASTEFPGVRAMLERWRVLPPNSPRNAVASIGIDVRKVVKNDSDPIRAAERFLQQHPTDLVVLAAHTQQGRMRWTRSSTSRPIARAAAAPRTLPPLRM